MKRRYCWPRRVDESVKEEHVWEGTLSFAEM